MICATLVNTQAHRQLLTGYTISSASQLKYQWSTTDVQWNKKKCGAIFLLARMTAIFWKQIQRPLLAVLYPVSESIHFSAIYTSRSLTDCDIGHDAAADRFSNRDRPRSRVRSIKDDADRRTTRVTTWVVESLTSLTLIAALWQMSASAEQRDIKKIET